MLSGGRLQGNRNIQAPKAVVLMVVSRTEGGGNTIVVAALGSGRMLSSSHPCSAGLGWDAEFLLPGFSEPASPAFSVIL